MAARSKLNDGGCDEVRMARVRSMGVLARGFRGVKGGRGWLYKGHDPWARGKRGARSREDRGGGALRCLRERARLLREEDEGGPPVCGSGGRAPVRATEP